MAVNELSPRAQPEDKVVYVAINPWQPMLQLLYVTASGKTRHVANFMKF